MTIKVHGVEVRVGDVVDVVLTKGHLWEDEYGTEKPVRINVHGLGDHACFGGITERNDYVAVSDDGDAMFAVTSINLVDKE
jgi:hypothetical protein